MYVCAKTTLETSLEFSSTDITNISKPPSDAAYEYFAKGGKQTTENFLSAIALSGLLGSGKLENHPYDHSIVHEI